MLKSAIYYYLHKSDGPSLELPLPYVFALPELDIKKFTVSNKKIVGNAKSHKRISLGGRTKSEKRATPMPYSHRAWGCRVEEPARV